MLTTITSQYMDIFIRKGKGLVTTHWSPPYPFRTLRVSHTGVGSAVLPCGYNYLVNMNDSASTLHEIASKCMEVFVRSGKGLVMSSPHLILHLGCCVRGALSTPGVRKRVFRTRTHP